MSQIYNLFGCCCDNSNVMAGSYLTTKIYGFPAFDSTFDPATYIASGIPPLGTTNDWNDSNQVWYNWDPLFKWLCVGSFVYGSGWTTKPGVVSFSVGDLVHKQTRIGAGTNRLNHTFWRCKVATPIGGDPAGSPDYFEPYQGNRRIDLNITTQSLAYGSPFFHYTPKTTYKTWTEVTNIYDYDDVLIETQTRVAEMDEYTGDVSITTASPGLTRTRLDLPADASPAYWNGYVLQWNQPIPNYAGYMYQSNMFGFFEETAFPGLPSFKVNVADIYYTSFTGEVKVTGVLTDFTISATEIFYEWEITIPWTTTQNKVCRVTQTLTLSDELDFNAAVGTLITNLPAVPAYGSAAFYETTTLGTVELTSVGQLPYDTLGANYVVLYQNERAWVNFGYFGQDGRWVVNKPSIRRVKYKIYANPHWSLEYTAGGSPTETEYNSAPLEHEFAPTDTTVEAAMVVIVDPSP